jgi:hypothetical protein
MEDDTANLSLEDIKSIDKILTPIQSEYAGFSLKGNVAFMDDNDLIALSHDSSKGDIKDAAAYDVCFVRQSIERGEYIDGMNQRLRQRKLSTYYASLPLKLVQKPTVKSLELCYKGKFFIFCLPGGRTRKTNTGRRSSKTIKLSSHLVRDFLSTVRTIRLFRLSLYVLLGEED